MSLSIEQLVCGRGRKALISPVGVEVPRGTAAVLRGPNGVGKTTFLRTLAGFLEPVSGTATLNGASLTEPDGLQEYLTYAGHADAVKASLSVAENLRFWSAMGSRESIDAALDAFQLTQISHRIAGTCSAGQKRRLGLARLMVSGADLWLMDEPTVSLDEQSRKATAEVLKAHLETGGMAVIATHDPDLIPAQTITLAPAAKDTSLDPFAAGEFA